MKPLKLLLISVFLFNGLSQAEYDDAYYTRLREHMIVDQIKSRGINDEIILNTFLNVKRHLFVPQKYQSEAYNDYPLPIGNDQTISQPYIVAFMTEALKPAKTHLILEIGTGSGYQAAILSKLVKEVYTIEIVEPLAQKAKKLLQELKLSNVTVKSGDGYQGWEEYAPFDGIIVTCAPDHIPQPLIDQLKVGGGMVIPVGQGNQDMVIVQKQKDGILKKSVLQCRFVPMTGEGVSSNNK